MSKKSSLRTVPLMGTLVTVEILGVGGNSDDAADREQAIDHALAWFRRVEECCTRFDPESELMRLSTQVGVAVPVSAILYEAVQFALRVAEETGGAFDPTIGATMESRGFNRNYRTGGIIRSGGAAIPSASRNLSFEPNTPASHRDVALIQSSKQSNCSARSFSTSAPLQRVLPWTWLPANSPTMTISPSTRVAIST